MFQLLRKNFPAKRQVLKLKPKQVRAIRGKMAGNSRFYLALIFQMGSSYAVHYRGFVTPGHKSCWLNSRHDHMVTMPARMALP